MKNNVSRIQFFRHVAMGISVSVALVCIIPMLLGSLEIGRAHV